MEQYSVLMSVYHKEDPCFFEMAIRSMLEQTVKTNDFVIVCDGSLTEELDAVLERYETQYPGIFQVVRLEKNVGIGAAANIGLQYCRNELIAKMDADDIAVANRCERQLAEFHKNPKLAVIGGYIDEFDQSPDQPFAVRVVPATNEEIRKFARRRQPFNNMTVMYRKSAVIAVGGYRSFRRGEDYDLYIRLLHSGYYAGNIPDVLVKARVNQGAMSRRVSKATLVGCICSRWNAFRIGFSTVWDFCYCVLGELLVFISPRWLQHYLFQKYLRSNKKDLAEVNMESGSNGESGMKQRKQL